MDRIKKTIDIVLGLMQSASINADFMFNRQNTKSHKLKTTGKLRNEKKNRNSVFKFLWGYSIFTTEPLWYRVLIVLITVTATVLIVLLLKGWAAPAFIVEKLSHLKASDISSFFKNKHP